MTTAVAWVEARVADLAAREFEQSLRTVGPQKPLGSQGGLPGRTVLRALRGRLRGLRVVASLPGGDPPMFLYLYHPRALSALLQDRRTVLYDAGWSRDPDTFVQRVVAEPVAPKTPLYDLIADAYGDKLNPGRTDVDGDPHELLATFRRVAGTPDPAEIYFLIADTARQR